MRAFKHFPLLSVVRVFYTISHSTICSIVHSIALHFTFLNLLLYNSTSSPAWSIWSSPMPINTASLTELWRITCRLSMDYCSSSSQGWGWSHEWWRHLDNTSAYIVSHATSAAAGLTDFNDFSDLPRNPRLTHATSAIRVRDFLPHHHSNWSVGFAQTSYV